MQGKTHRLGGVNAALGGYLALHHTGMTLPDVSLLVQLAVVYPFAMYGATASDLDHHIGSIPSRDPVSILAHKALHITTPYRKRYKNVKKVRESFPYKLAGLFDARHRSWQTHSEFSMVFSIGVLWYTCFSENAIFHGIDAIILALIMAGLNLGLMAHIFLDGITPEGIHLVTGMLVNGVVGKKVLPEKIKVVPNNSWFATGNQWEAIWCKLLTISAYLMLFYIIYLALPWEINFTKLSFM